MVLSYTRVSTFYVTLSIFHSMQPTHYFIRLFQESTIKAAPAPAQCLVFNASNVAKEESINSKFDVLGEEEFVILSIG